MDIEKFLKRHAGVREVLAAPRAIRRRLIRWRREPAQTILARLGDISVGDLVVRVDEYQGSFRISTRSHLLLRLLEHGKYEPALSKIFLEHIDPERDVIDVGANIGFYSVAAAKKLTTGRVLAIEPTVGACERLNHNIKLNGVENKVVVFQGVALDKSRETSVNFVRGMEEYSSVGSLIHHATSGQEVESIAVSGASIDDLVRDNRLTPALVKIDTEGAEHLVLQGARQTIENFRPIVIAEFIPRFIREAGGDPETILEMFRDLGYEIRNPLDPLSRVDAMEFGDIICIPPRI